MKYVKIARWLTVAVIAILIALPIYMIISAHEAGADETSQTIQEYNGDYVFFIVEENKTPLAAVPTKSSASSPFVWVTFSSFIIFAIAAYSIWYVTVRYNIKTLYNALPEYARPAGYGKSEFFNPSASYNNLKNLEYTVTKNCYF